MIALIRKLHEREPSDREKKIFSWLSVQSSRLKCWYLRTFFKTVKITFKGASYSPQLGDIYVKREVNVEYVGKGRWIPITKDEWVKLSMGDRIKAHYGYRKKNNYIVRDGEIILHA